MDLKEYISTVNQKYRAGYATEHSYRGALELLMQTLLSQIFTKCKSLEESLFYINKTIENNWSRSRYVSIKIMRSGPFGMKNSRSGGSPLWILWQPLRKVPILASIGAS